MTALVSVVIPCRNYGRFLAEAIQSVLAQTYPTIELLVVDYGSTDGSDDVAVGYSEVRLLRQPNRGVSEARNAGLAASHGEFLVFLDADDRLLPDAVSTSLRCAVADRRIAFVYGHQRFVEADGSPAADRRPSECLREDPYGHMLRANSPLRAPSAILYRRQPLQRVGGFAAGLDGCADLDLNLRLVRELPIGCNDRVVTLTRVHDANLSRRWSHMLARAVIAHRRQRSFVRGHPGYLADYRAGLRLARSYWGGHVADQLLGEARAGHFGAALGDLLTLARYHPAGAAGLPRRAVRELRTR